jgi:hypothetical protein
MGQTSQLKISKSPLLQVLYKFARLALLCKEILLNLSMKCWNSALNAQGWRVTIVVVQVEPVREYM